MDKLVFKNLKAKALENISYFIDEEIEDFIIYTDSLTPDNFIHKVKDHHLFTLLVLVSKTKTELSKKVDEIKNQFFSDKIISKNYDDQDILCYEFENAGWMEEKDMKPWQRRMARRYYEDHETDED